MGLLSEVLFSCGIILSIVQKSRCDPIAVIDESQILGQAISCDGIQVSQFLGIPYAEPPLEDLRFQKPVPYTLYPTVFLALNAPPACWQRSYYPWPWYDHRVDKSEDCLFLNIWAPDDAGPDNKKAVIYFIYGGGFSFGSIHQPVYNGAPLSAKGDVVVVTVNYRVGPFGFLTSDTDDAPGNVGLYDILEGLRWVNNHIESFGGDRSSITIAGQGFGSVAVGLLSISPLAKGLFKRQIMESGSPANLDASNNETNMQLSQELAEDLHCANETFTVQDNPEDVVNCLKHQSADLVSSVHAGIEQHSSMTFVAQYGDELIPTDPLQTIINGSITCDEILIGNTLDEGSFEVTTRYPKVYGFFGQRNPHIDDATGEYMIRDFFKNFTDPDAVVKHYLNNSTLTDDSDSSVRLEVYTSYGDASILCPTVFFAEKCAANGGNVYFYLWRHRPSNSPWALWMGATHFSEVEFVFGSPIDNVYNYFPDEVQLSAEVVEIWSSFAKTGKPSIPWPLYSKEIPNLTYLGPRSGSMETGTGPHLENCNFFRPYYGF